MYLPTIVHSIMANIKIKYFIITGEPGVGKTTLTKKLTSILSEKGVKTTGFYTEEVRRNRAREGFDVVTLDGARGRLAREQALLGSPAEFTVGRYGVLVQEFETVAMPALMKQEDTTLLVIDEIGKMEFFSQPFKRTIRDIFSPQSNCVILATIPVKKGDALIESVRHNSRAKVWVVTKENRNNIHEEILLQMKDTLNCII